MRSSWVVLGLLQLVGRSAGTTTSTGYPTCTGTVAFIGDGYCDESLNNALCGFDDGDCCECDCSLDIIGDSFPCGSAGYNCIDPASACVGALCSNGIPGIQTGDACCSTGCGQCGGSGCHLFGGLDASQCCTGNIASSGDLCSVTGAAPCIVDNPCSPNPCGLNEACTPVDFSSDFTCSCEAGFEDVGSGGILSCVALECSNGVAGIQNGLACCSGGCGDCGGFGCHLYGGLGPEDCCTGSILSTGDLCSVTLSAPCVVDDPCFPSPCGANEVCTSDGVSASCSCEVGFEDIDDNDGVLICTEIECTNGLPGIQSGRSCCLAACGQCGGSGCHLFGGGLGASNCCESDILDDGLLCSVSLAAPCIVDTAAVGDPHMTGLSGQKFDFTGQDGSWYSLISDLPATHINMRVTTPVPTQPIITYITGISVLTTDSDGLEHSVVILVKDPHSLKSSCPAGVFPCLANGALSVFVDRTEALLQPGTVQLATGVAITAVNLPGSCRSFGFENYWETKKQEYAQEGRMLREAENMAEWILGDTTATNIEECAAYVSQQMAEEANGLSDGLFAHQSEHALFKIMTPSTTVRLSHGKLHQVAMRDPTDQFDLPDHHTWQMNIAVDPTSLSSQAEGILGETIVPTLDANGDPIMHGMGAIRGTQADYRVAGPLETDFVQSGHHEAHAH